MNTSISINIITRDCPDQLRNCLNSFQTFLRPGDELVIGDMSRNAATRAVARAFAGCKVRIERLHDLLDRDLTERGKHWLGDAFAPFADHPHISGGILRDFAEARQRLLKASKNPIILWLDADDIFPATSAHRDTIDAHFKAGHSNLFLEYRYDFDDHDQTCTTTLWRERLFLRDRYEWKGVCHESAIPKSPEDARARIIRDLDLAVIHRRKAHGPVSRAADVRNYIILRAAIERAERAKEWIDPRWLFYLGNACRGLQLFAEAAHWYGRHLSCSGSREDRFTSAYNCAFIYILRGRPWRALDWGFQAHKINPEEPRAFSVIGRAYYALGRYQEAIDWLTRALQMPRPLTLHAVDPNEYTAYPRLFLALSLRELGRHQDAIDLTQQILQERPNWPRAQELLAALRGDLARRQQETVINSALSAARSDEHRARMAEAFMPALREHFPQLQIEPAETRPKRSVDFFCGPGWYEWDEQSLLERGIGGSEKAVILITRELARRGYQVTVYGNPPEDRRHLQHKSGVTYRPFQAFNPLTRYANLVIWRNPAVLFQMPRLRARRILLDLHDVQDPRLWAPGSPLHDRLHAGSYEAPAAAIFKSRFHVQTARLKLKDKHDAFEPVVINNPIVPHTTIQPFHTRSRRIVYLSSPDRGLLRALRIWGRVANALPDVEFVIGYGFNEVYRGFANSREYGHFAAEGTEMHLWEYAEACMDLIDRLPRVTFHRKGLVDSEVRRLLSTSVAWFYPTRFDEISCMAGLEAQAAGCWPITTPHAALVETVHNCTFCKSDDDFVRALEDCFRRGTDLDRAREANRTWVTEHASVQAVVDRWEQLLVK